MRQLLTLIYALITTSSFAQTDFNNYQSLRSAGALPADFSTPTQEKIKKASKEHLEDLTAKQKEIFIEEVNYAIDDLLKSGEVTFGDPVSLYLQKLGDLLVEGDPELEGKLRFYTFKSNEANAFSTDQGMVFVTTGLIAQMTNEAQLAFVLAHEIIHFREKHVVDLFDFSMDKRTSSYNEKVRLFSKYSRDNEFEADSLAVALFHQAGFKSSEINMTFDVLMYSYLPFEELVFPKTYFNNQWFYVPTKSFDEDKKDITARSNYDDRLNSHPNIAKRKEELTKKISKFADWGTTLNRDAKEFAEIRNICRFEYILNDVYAGENTHALYSIFIMEKQFPSSRFLRNCKSQIWLDLMKYEKPKEDFGYSFYDTYGSYDYNNYSYYEGNINTLNLFLKGLPKEGKIALGLRTIKDNYNRDTTDKFASQLWEKALEFTAYNDILEDIKYSKFTFHEAIEEIARKKVLNDSLATVEAGLANSWDKYETIKNQKSGFDVESGIDSSKYYLYGISDMMNDSLFMKKIEFYTAKMKTEYAKNDLVYEMTDDELGEYFSDEYENKLHIQADSILLINPVVFEIEGYRSIDYKKSDQLEMLFIESLRKMADEHDIGIQQLDRSDQHNMTADDYNNLSQLMRSLDKRIGEKEVNSFMLDKEMLSGLKEQYKTDYVVWFDLSHEYDAQIYPGPAILNTILFPIGLFYFPIKLMSGHRTDITCYVLDLQKGELVVNESYTGQEPASRKFIELRLDALFNQLKQEKSNDE